MTWSSMIFFALPAVLLWAVGAWMAFRSSRVWALTLTGIGLLVFASYIVLMWMSLERPPLRTMGETRLWYAFFLPLAGLLTYARWRYKWILSFSTLLATVFVCINLLKPEIHNKTLMPALQSPWFAPHVIIYMFAYALLGAAAVVAIYLLFRRHYMQGQSMCGTTARVEYVRLHSAESKQACPLLSLARTLSPTGGGSNVDDPLLLCDDLVSVGLAFMTMGMLTGALWAKEAWGHYWSWDPKETWAAITWFAYLTYLHLRCNQRMRRMLALSLLVISFACLQMCWWGVNYLPAAQGSSVHTYNLN